MTDYFSIKFNQKSPILILEWIASRKCDYYEWGQYLTNVQFHFVRSVLINVSLLKRLLDVNRNEPLLISRKAELTQLFTSQFSSPNVEKSIFSLNLEKFKFRTRWGDFGKWLTWSDRRISASLLCVTQQERANYDRGKILIKPFLKTTVYHMEI